MTDNLTELLVALGERLSPIEGRMNKLLRLSKEVSDVRNAAVVIENTAIRLCNLDDLDSLAAKIAIKRDLLRILDILK